MTTLKWIKGGQGLQYYNHITRKRGVKFDRYFRGRYKVDGKTTTVSFGWESEWIAAERSEMKKSGEKASRLSFADYCKGELSRLKANAKKGTGPKTIKEERELAEIEAQVKAETEAEAERQKAIEDKQSISFSGLFHEHYIPFVKAEGKKSWSQELSLFKTWIEKPIGGKAICDISYLDIERVKHTVGKKRSERTTQYCLAIIRRVFNFAIMRDFFDGVNPTRKVKFPSPDNGRVRFFTRDQAEELISTLKEHSPQLCEMTEVSLFSGLRWGEVAGLTWLDVDLDQRTIFVRDPKNKHSRTIPMPVRLQKMFQAKRTGDDAGFIFPDKKGGRSTWVSKTIKRTIADLGWNDGVTDNRQRLTFHSCRHSFCSWLAMEGVPLHTIGTLAGHRNLKMTERYAHLSPDTLQAAISLLDNEQRQPSAKIIQLRVNGEN